MDGAVYQWGLVNEPTPQRIVLSTTASTISCSDGLTFALLSNGNVAQISSTGAVTTALGNKNIICISAAMPYCVAVAGNPNQIQAHSDAKHKSVLFVQ